MKKMCATCKYLGVPNSEPPCIDCRHYDKWVMKIPAWWAREWLGSFDASSATQCFTAVNQLKQMLEGDNGLK